MKCKLTILFFALALLLTVSAVPVYAGDEDDSTPPPCNVCDGRDAGNWG